MSFCEGCVQAILTANADKEKAINDAKLKAKETNVPQAIYQDADGWKYLAAETAIAERLVIYSIVSQYNSA